jgi:hypothetical protein
MLLQSLLQLLHRCFYCCDSAAVCSLLLLLFPLGVAPEGGD